MLEADPRQVIPLPEHIGPAQALELRDAFRALDRARPVRLDAGRLRHVGYLGLQVLLAASRDLRAAGGGMTLDPCAPAIDRALGDLAIPETLLPRSLAT
jgi:anti-anti-sigma regulatory factor